MAGINAVLAVEDDLSQSVGSRLLREVNIDIDLCIGKKGITELKKRLPKFLQMAERQPVFLLIDMDRPTQRLPCVPERAAERSPSLKKTRIRLKEFYDRAD